MLLRHPKRTTHGYIVCALIAFVAYILLSASAGSGRGESASAAVPAGKGLEKKALPKRGIGAPASANVPLGCESEARHYLKVNPGSPENGSVVTLGQRIELDMMIHTFINGDYFAAHQSYLTFTSELLQIVDPYSDSCDLSGQVAQDPTIFDFELQNEICNGPDPCEFGSNIVAPGSIAFASGAWPNPNYNGPDFRVATIAFCVSAPGEAIIHWEFSPPDPETRDTMVVMASHGIVSNPDCYDDYIINAVDPSATPALTPVTLPTRTRTSTRTRTPSPTITPTITRTYTSTNTPLPTDTPIPSGTPTPCVFNVGDVQPTDYFYDSVRYLYCNGVISGYADRTFKPYNETTRGQLCKIIALAEGWPIESEYKPRFSDVPPDYPFFGYIMAAYSHNIISGYSDGTFRPGDNVTRAQLAKIIVLAEQWPVNTDRGPHFFDVPSTDVFYPFVETVFNRGIISGYADATFHPNESATRGQISKIVYNAIREP